MALTTAPEAGGLQPRPLLRPLSRTTTSAGRERRRMRTALRGPGCPGRGGARLVPVPVPGSSRLRALWPCLRGLLGRGAGRAMAAAAWMPAVGAGPGRESAAGRAGPGGKRGLQAPVLRGARPGGAAGARRALRGGSRCRDLEVARPGPAKMAAPPAGRDGREGWQGGRTAGLPRSLRAARHAAPTLRWDRAAPGAVPGLGVCRSLRWRPGARCARQGAGVIRGRSRAGRGCHRHGEFCVPRASE